jgi:hypothetical protein
VGVGDDIVSGSVVIDPSPAGGALIGSLPVVVVEPVLGSDDIVELVEPVVEPCDIDPVLAPRWPARVDLPVGDIVVPVCGDAVVEPVDDPGEVVCAHAAPDVASAAAAVRVSIVRIVGLLMVTPAQPVGVPVVPTPSGAPSRLWFAMALKRRISATSGISY